MTNEEFLQRYDSGKPNFTKDELELMAFELFGNWVDTAERKCYRLAQETETIFEVNGRIFAVSWLKDLTEMQENDFDDAEVYEVEKKEKVIFTYERMSTHD